MNDDFKEELKDCYARIKQLEAECADQVQWVKDLADMQIKSEARIAQLEAALHRISLGSQNSSTTKENLGREARAALEGK